jgi:hypothetical protein
MYRTTVVRESLRKIDKTRTLKCEGCATTVNYQTKAKHVPFARRPTFQQLREGLNAHPSQEPGKSGAPGKDKSVEP